MANKYTDDDWLEELAGRSKYNNKDIGSTETKLLRKNLLSHHQILHKLVQTDSNTEIQQLTARLNKEGLLGGSLLKKSLWDKFLDFIPTSQPLWIAAIASLLLVVGILVKSPDYIDDLSGHLEDTYRKLVPKKYKGVFPGEIIAGDSVQIVDDPDIALANWEADLIGAGMQYQSTKSAGDKSIIELHIKLSKDKLGLSEQHQRGLLNAPNTGEWIIILRQHK